MSSGDSSSASPVEEEDLDMEEWPWWLRNLVRAYAMGMTLVAAWWIVPALIKDNSMAAKRRGIFWRGQHTTEAIEWWIGAVLHPRRLLSAGGRVADRWGPVVWEVVGVRGAVVLGLVAVIVVVAIARRGAPSGGLFESGTGTVSGAGTVSGTADDGARDPRPRLDADHHRSARSMIDNSSRTSHRGDGGLSVGGLDDPVERRLPSGSEASPQAGERTSSRSEDIDVDDLEKRAGAIKAMTGTPWSKERIKREMLKRVRQGMAVSEAERETHDQAVVAARRDALDE